MPGSLPDLSVVFSYEIVVHPSTFKPSELLLWVVNSCTVNTEAFFGTSTAAHYSNYLVALSRATFVDTQEQLKEFSIVDRHTQLTFCRKYEHGYNCVVLPLFHPIAPTKRTGRQMIFRRFNTILFFYVKL